MMKKKTSTREKGITLIALIVTIIVLLILAGVTINLAVNNQGIFNKAKTATRAYKNATEEEEASLALLENEIDKYIPKNDDSKVSEEITYTENGETKTLTTETPVGTKIGTTANISGKEGETGVNLDWYLFDVSDDGKTAYLVSTPTYWVPDTTREVRGAWVPRLVDEADKAIQVSYRPNVTFTISHLVSTTTFDERNKEKTNVAKLQKLAFDSSMTHAMRQAIQKLANGTNILDPISSTIVNGQANSYSSSSVTYTPSAKTLSYFKSVNPQWSTNRGSVDFKILNENEQSACYLADADIFEGIKDQVNKAEGNLKGKIQTLVGGASAEQWCKAYNNQAEVKNDTTKKITCEYRATSVPGYIYKVNDKHDYWTGTNTIFGNDIYGAANNNGNTTNNPFYNYSCWWLASPSADLSTSVCSVDGSASGLGNGDSYNYYYRFSLFASVSL